MPLQLIEHAEPRLFQDAVIDYLLQSEAECCGQIGLVGRMARNGYSPVSVDELDQPILWTIQEGPRIGAIALQTLKDKMIVTRALPVVMETLADALVSHNWTGQSLIGVTPSISTLVQHYSTLTARAPSLKVRLRVFQLERVIWPRAVRGTFRLSNPMDRQAIAHFITGFEADTGEHSQENPLDRADRLIADRRIYLWTDPDPIAMAGWAGPTPNGVRINWVYTPRELRGKGYASNLVAHLTHHLLAQGRKYCFLFTDLANPTSNSIYQRIGYRRISDSEQWDFS